MEKDGPETPEPRGGTIMQAKVHACARAHSFLADFVDEARRKLFRGEAFSRKIKDETFEFNGR